MEQMYNLGIRLSMTSNGLEAAAGAAMRAFSGLERGALGADKALAALNARASGVKSLSMLEGDALRAERSLVSLDRQMARMQFMGNTNSKSYQWTAMQQSAAQQTAFDASQALQAGQQSALATAQAEAAASGARVAAATRGAAMVGGGVALTMAGGGILGFLDEATKKAGQLQTLMTTVQTATGATSTEMADLNRQAVTIGMTNQMSSIDVASVMQAAVGAGITLGAKAAGVSPAEMVRQVTPALANLGEVLQMTKGMQPTDSAKVAVEFAHIFGAYKPTEMTGMTNMLGRALFITPSTPEQMLTLTSQFAQQAKPLYGMNVPRISAAERTQRTQNWVNDSIQTAALESVLGQQTRGGTQIGAIITRSMALPTSARSAGQIRALHEMERISKSTFDDPKTHVYLGTAHAMQVMAAVAMNERDPRKVASLYKAAFGTVGARQAGILGDPLTIGAFGQLGNQLGANASKGGLPTLATIQKAFNNTEAGQRNQAAKNWETLQTVIGVQLLPAVTELARGLANLLARITAWAQANQGLVGPLARIVAVFAALAVVVGPLLVLFGVLAIAGVGLGAVLIPVIATVVLVAAAITALVLIIQNWGTITRLAGNVFTWFGDKIKGVLQLLGLWHDPAKRLAPGQAVVHGQVATKGSDVFAGQRVPPGMYRDPTTGKLHAVGTGPGNATGAWRGQMPPRGMRWDPTTHAFVRASPAVAPLPGRGSAPRPAGAINFHPGAVVLHVAAGTHPKKAAQQLADAVMESLSTALAQHDRYGTVHPRGLDVSRHVAG